MISIKIVGTGIGGLFAAYHLTKLISHPQQIQIEFYDQGDESTPNASTYSLAWLNVVYPSKLIPDAPRDREASLQAQVNYDQYRLESLKAWELLNQTIEKDGIQGVIASHDENIIIKNKIINSLFVFFNEQQKTDLTNGISRLKKHTSHYQTEEILLADLITYFPFISHLSKDITIYNIEEEQLIHPKLLRSQLINFLHCLGIQFHWNTQVTPEMIARDPDTHWIIAAGNGSLPLIKDTQLGSVDFIERSLADVIHCTLSSPIDLKGKVFHFAATDATPSFHLRNDEKNPHDLKIIIVRQSAKKANLEQMAQAIFSLLKINIVKYECDQLMERPMTHDGRPLVEFNLGNYRNIHLVYGHSLYTNAAKLFASFASHLAHLINKKELEQKKENVFQSCLYSSELEQFSATNRFIKCSITEQKLAENWSKFFKFFKPQEEHKQPYRERQFVAKL